MFRMRERPDDLARYAAICWDCGLLRGFDTKKQADRAIIRAADGEIDARGWHVEEYDPGDREPHGRPLCPGCAVPLTPAELAVG